MVKKLFLIVHILSSIVSLNLFSTLMMNEKKISGVLIAAMPCCKVLSIFLEFYNCNSLQHHFHLLHIIPIYTVGVCIFFSLSWHLKLVRETAIQCLVAVSGLSHARIYPMRTQVLRAVIKALDDPKRAVRQETVRCRQAWASSIASRSLHFEHL